MKRVLIVDDAATVRLYHRRILAEAGFEVEEAVNGYEALEKALRTPFDLLLVDINMPKMDGYSLLRALRAEAALDLVPAIMISTEAEARDADLAYAAGANFYLCKPVQPDELVAAARMFAGAGAA
jgi:two-component system chemotaxis response regulator CheY